MQTATPTDAQGGLARWQQDVSRAYFPLQVDGRDRDRFRGRLDVWPLGPVSATRITCDPVVYRRDRSHLQDDRESALLISIPSRSEVAFRQFGRHAVCRPGGSVIERSDAPYEYSHADPDVQWVVKVPLESLRARIGSAEAHVGLCLDLRHGLGSYFHAALGAAVKTSDRMTSSARDLAGQHLIEILALALLGDGRALDSAGSTIRRAHRDRAETFIHRNLKNPKLSPDLIADHCGISLRYLQQLFAGSGRSVSAYVRDCRLVRCHEEICAMTRGETIAMVAYRWGFGDQSQFGRHYRARYGCTPRDAAARRQHS